MADAALAAIALTLRLAGVTTADLAGGWHAAGMVAGTHALTHQERAGSAGGPAAGAAAQRAGLLPAGQPGATRAGRPAHPGLGLGLLPFTFAGLVVGSVLYSLPFVVQPLQNAFEALGETPLEAAATLRASPLDTFFHVVLPLARPGYLTATVMGFAHTVGEFGVVLMMGGNIPDQTRVVSVQIYDHVEALEYAQAHWLSGGMLVFSFAVLLALYVFNPTGGKNHERLTPSDQPPSKYAAASALQAAGFTLDLNETWPGRGVTALFGPSGCGKTTTLRTVAGCCTCTGRAPCGRARRGLARTTTGLCAHPPAATGLCGAATPALFAHLTVRGNVEYGMKRVPAAQRKRLPRPGGGTCWALTR
jgi:hypothetical protein